MSETRQSKFYYGFIVAAACFSIQAIGVGSFLAYGVFFNPLMSEFGWSRAIISGAAALAFFTMGLVGIFVGRLNDRFGPRNLMRITAVFLGMGYLLMFKLATIWQLYLFYGIIFGIGLSSIDVVALSTIARWFSQRRGMMTGIVKVGTGAGQFTLTLLAGVLISSYGWRNAYLIIGSAALPMLILLAQVLKRDPSQIDRSANRIESKPKIVSNRIDSGLSLHETLRTFQLWILSFANLAVTFCLLIVMVHIVPHARDIGVSPTHAAGILSTIGAVSMIGRFMAGVLIDRIGSKRVLIICFLLLIPGLLWLQMADTLWMLYLFASIYGIAHGGIFTTISPLVAELFGTRNHGVILGIVICFGTTGGAMGPILAGYTYDIIGSYSLIFRLIALMSTFGLGLILSLKQIRDTSRYQSMMTS